ncbi:hypothetical protein SKAU_G00248180 [Synaphobranchus kaupii]|uniref:Uncharacterized protein n=1 Tax=Synaphobranchus kaupii TaxID=118154 RepID=A0A9Q1IRD5_SYNKA|nr:hypothetical protein SKAU_G00248180 [Synaphobranchus kaupii]
MVGDSVSVIDKDKHLSYTKFSALPPTAEANYIFQVQAGDESEALVTGLAGSGDDLIRPPRARACQDYRLTFARASERAAARSSLAGRER